MRFKVKSVKYGRQKTKLAADGWRKIKLLVWVWVELCLNKERVRLLTPAKSSWID